MERHTLRSSIKSVNTDFEHKALIVIGDGAEVLDTMGPYYRLGEDYQVAMAAPQVDSYHLVMHELAPGWDITEEHRGYRIESDIAFRDVDPDELERRIKERELPSAPVIFEKARKIQQSDWDRWPEGPA